MQTLILLLSFLTNILLVLSVLSSQNATSGSKKSTSDSYQRAKFAFAGFRLWISYSSDGFLLISRTSKKGFTPFFSGAAAGKRCDSLCKPPQSCKISTSAGLFHRCRGKFSILSHFYQVFQRFCAAQGEPWDFYMDGVARICTLFTIFMTKQLQTTFCQTF